MPHELTYANSKKKKKPRTNKTERDQLVGARGHGGWGVSERRGRWEIQTRRLSQAVTGCGVGRREHSQRTAAREAPPHEQVPSPERVRDVQLVHRVSHVSLGPRLTQPARQYCAATALCHFSHTIQERASHLPLYSSAP